MADKLADLSGDERQKRIAELKAKMQAAAKQAKKAAAEQADEEEAPVERVAQTAPGAEAVAVADEQGGAAKEVSGAVEAVKEAAPAAKAPAAAAREGSRDGAPSNGAAAAADVASAPRLVAGEPVIPEETPEEKAQKEMSRREFLTYAWGGTLALLALESGVGMYFFMMPRFKAGEFGGKFFIGPESALPSTEAPPEPFTAGKFWLVNTTDEGPKALYMVCTHLGCLYKWEQANSRFECPCHGSKFTREGYYIEGPAPRSLDTFPLTIEEGEVVVDTGKKTTGSPASQSPARALPA
ncbi:MAG: Rieske 2Fe-2S domain-containing protein [Caldilineaceae bacterium]|nr:Rieske 2Fe-2S domain-containing protein [Caldilineaceae bacterium]